MTKILLVEDDKSLREIYGVRLLAEGYDIVSAGDGEEALAMAIKERPQLIVSDVMMPKISGFDMLDILRSTTETKEIKVIMMTALSSEDQRARGESLGADRYLVKSQVGIEDVVRTVHEVLGDAPVAATAAPTFATPYPTAAARPAAVAPNQPMERPAAAPVYAAPQEQPAAPAAPQPPVAQAAPQQPPTSLPQPTAPFSTNRPANLGDRIIQPIAKPETDGPDLASLMEQELNQTPAAPAPNPAPSAPFTPAPQPTVPNDAPLPFVPPAPAQPATDAEEMAFAQQLQQAQQPQPATQPAMPQQPSVAPQQAPQPQPQVAPSTPPMPQMAAPIAPPLPPPSPFTPTDEPHGAISFEETPRQ